MKSAARRGLAAVAILAVLALQMMQMPAGRAQQPTPAPTTTPVHHFVVLMQENHTFDNYFGTYPGVDGTPPDVCMPVNPAVAARGCIKPLSLGGKPIEDLNHTPQTFAAQYDKGLMDGFVRALNLRNQTGSLAMGYYDDRQLPFYWNLADRYVLFDHFFSSARGGSGPNHMYWVTGTNGPAGSSLPVNGYDSSLKTIFDSLQAAGVSWKFYVQTNPALAGQPFINYKTVRTVKDPNLASQVVWNPLLLIRRFVEDPILASHIVPLDQYYQDLRDGTLPAVAYITPSGSSEHPPGSLQSGQEFTRSLLNTLMQSTAWDSSAFLLTYDDWGGWYDHVKPPQVDTFGYGLRVPALMISPFAKQGRINSSQYDFTSILAFIEYNWGLKPLAARDQHAAPLLDAFDFSASPRPAMLVPFDRVSSQPASGPPRDLFIASYGAGILLAVAILALAVLRSRRRPGAPALHLGEGDAA